MNHTFSAPVTDAQRQRDALLGALVGLARSTVNEPKTEDTDRVLAAGLQLAAEPNAAESALLRMTDIVEAEKHRVAPNCAACAMPCGNTSNYDLARLWGAPAEICALKVRLLSAVCVLAGQKTTAQIQKELCDDLYLYWQRTGTPNCCCPSSHGPRDCASSNFSRNKKAFPA